MRIPSGTSGVCQLENSILPLQSDMKQIFRLSIYLFRGDDPQYELYIRKYLFVYTKHDLFINTREICIYIHIYISNDSKSVRSLFRVVCDLLSIDFTRFARVIDETFRKNLFL